MPETYTTNLDLTRFDIYSPPAMIALIIAALIVIGAAMWYLDTHPDTPVVPSIIAAIAAAALGTCVVILAIGAGSDDRVVPVPLRESDDVAWDIAVAIHPPNAPAVHVETVGRYAGRFDVFAGGQCWGTWTADQWSVQLHFDPAAHCGHVVEVPEQHAGHTTGPTDRSP